MMAGRDDGEVEPVALGAQDQVGEVRVAGEVGVSVAASGDEEAFDAAVAVEVDLFDAA